MYDGTRCQSWSPVLQFRHHGHPRTPAPLRAPVGPLSPDVRLPSRGGFAASSLRFHGNGAGDVDRVKILIDDPAASSAGPPADVGAADFTIEFWMKASAADDTAGPVACGANTAWINGNVVVDRDRFGADRKFGISIAGGRVVFGVSGEGTGDLTICGVRNVLDAAWHHVAVARERATGRMEIFVDGLPDAQGDGPGGDVSYPDDAAAGAPNDPIPISCSAPGSTTRARRSCPTRVSSTRSGSRTSCATGARSRGPVPLHFRRRDRRSLSSR